QDPALPITLLAFDAKPFGGMVELKWTTASEIGNAYFTIERSGTGELQFDSIAVVTGAGDSRNIRHYQAFDRHPLPGVSYYRLRQTDFDGQTTTSNVVRVENSGLPSISLYPNPA